MFQPSDQGGMIAEWIPSDGWLGWPGIVHGGIVSTVLDEAMAKAVSADGSRALTAEMKVRFRRPVNPGKNFTVRGWVVENSKRCIRTEAALHDSDGHLCAHASATFLRPQPEA